MSSKLDSETRIHEDDHLALKLWLRLLTCTNMVEAELRQRLRENFGSTLPRFDLLAQLDRHPEGLSMGQLSRLMMVSGGNVTGLVSQLVKEDLVSRTAMEHDRRAYRVNLTRAGKKHFKEMANVHEGWVVELLGALSHDDQEQLMDQLSAVKSSVAGVPKS